MNSDISIHLNAPEKGNCNGRCSILREDNQCIYGNKCPSIENPKYEYKTCAVLKGYKLDIKLFENYARSIGIIC